MLSGFYILHKKNPQGTEVVPTATLATFKTCLRLMHFAWLHEGEELVNTEQYQIFYGEKAYQFLLEVICGLHSPVIGETEVFGQYKAFLQNSTIDYPLAPILTQAITDTKRIRAKYLRDLGAQSYGSLVRKMLPRAADVRIIGSGLFVEDLLPWICKDQNQVCLYVRDVQKAQEKFAKTRPQMQFKDIAQNKIEQGVVIVAAPLLSREIEDLVTNKNLIVIDLRGESQQDECKNFLKYHNLSQFFAVIEQNQKKMAHVKEEVLSAIAEFSDTRMKIENLRPFGWDDICVW